MQVQIAKQVPDFEVDAYIRGHADAQTIKLSDYRGQWVVLAFYPRDFTFVCPTEIEELAELHEEFKAEKAVVLAASTDSYFSHKAWYETDERLAGVNFPVLADTSHELARMFGILLEDGTALRGTYIIDPDGILRHMLVNDNDVGRSMAETLRTLRALRTGELCPSSWEPGQETIQVSIPEVVA